LDRGSRGFRGTSITLFVYMIILDCRLGIGIGIQYGGILGRRSLLFVDNYHLGLGTRDLRSWQLGNRSKSTCARKSVTIVMVVASTRYKCHGSCGLNAIYI